LTGNFLIPIESAILDQIDSNEIPTTIKDESDSLDTFCSTFPPTNCFESEKPDELKNDVELFQEQFCLK
jgi:hypothetical protein